MDPTMQSPFRRNIPVPPPYNRLPPLSNGIQITVPSGPHYYSDKSWIGSISQGNTPQQAFDSLSRHATPFQGGAPAIDGGVIDIPGIGPVQQLVDPDRLTIVNSTQPGHILHPGNVFRSVVQEGDNLYVVTQGYGTGVFPPLNEFAGSRGWRFTDFGIRRELNPYTLLGYPMDEMNAVVDIDGQSSTIPPGSNASGASDNSIENSFLGGIDPMNPTQAVSLPVTGGTQGIVSNKPAPRLVRMIAKESRASRSEGGVPPVPFVPSNEVLSPDDRASFGDLFGNWTSSPDGGISPRNPNLAVPPPESSRPTGIFSGKPMPQWVTPPPIWGARYNSEPFGGSIGNWYDSVTGGASSPEGGSADTRSMSQLQESQGPLSLMDAYLQYLARLNGNKPQASVFDAAPLTAPFDASDPNPPARGLAGWITSLAGVAPQNSTQPASPQTRELAGSSYGGNPVQQWSDAPIGRAPDNSAASGYGDRNWFTTREAS